MRQASADFEPWYRFFPWEDWRDGRPAILDQTIVPLLEQWAKGGKSEPSGPLGRRERMRHCFGLDGSPWDEEKVLDRYELLYEAGLVEEARRDGREADAAAHEDCAARRGDALRPSPDSRDRHRAAARPN